MNTNKYIALILLCICNVAHADIETDKNAGICTAYMTLRGKNSGAEVAIRMADNQNRALLLAKEWIRGYKGMRNAGAAMAFDGDSACRKVGLRPSQY